MKEPNLVMLPLRSCITPPNGYDLISLRRRYIAENRTL